MHDGNFIPLAAGLRRAEVIAVGPDGRLRVAIPGEAELWPELWAESLVAAGPEALGRIAVVAPCDGGGLVVLGLIQTHARAAEASHPIAEVDGDKVVITGRHQVVLRCGKASITLTADGRVAIRGTQVLSRAEGPNRVQGASVQLN